MLCTVGVKHLLCVAAVAVCLAASPSRGRACYYGGCEDLELVVVPAAVGGTLAGLATLGVLGVDLSLALRGEPHPNELAIANVLLGVVDLGGGIALAFAGDDLFLGVGLGFTTAGLALLIDGIVALALGPGGTRAPPAVSLSIDAGPLGAGVGLEARF